MLSFSSQIIFFFWGEETICSHKLFSLLPETQSLYPEKKTPKGPEISSSILNLKGLILCHVNSDFHLLVQAEEVLYSRRECSCPLAKPAKTMVDRALRSCVQRDNSLQKNLHYPSALRRY